MSIIGIDFGTENCHIATIQDGGIELVSNEDGQRMTPSYITFGENCRRFGCSAKNSHITNFKNTVFGFKRLLGHQFSDSFIWREITYLPYSICEMPDGSTGVKVSYCRKETVFSIQQLVAMLLYKLKETAEMALKIQVENCVLSVPSYFTDAARRALLDAAHIAGLNVLKLMNDTAAAALSYGFYQNNPNLERPQMIVFINFGHSSLQVSVCSCEKNKLKIIATTSDFIGGRDFDNLIVQHFATQFKEKYNLDVISSERAIIRLMQECQKLKKQLTVNPNALPLNIECFMEDKDVSSSLSRVDLENICKSLLDKMEETMQRVMIDAKLNRADISSVELVGGSSRIPAIKALVQKVYGCEPRTSLNLDEAVARGCALQCAMLSPNIKVREFTILDVQPYQIRLRWWISKGEQGEIVVFPKNHQFPYSKFLTFYRKENFTLEALYCDANSGSGPDSRLGSFSIFGVIPTSSGECSKLCIKVRLNIHGVFAVCTAESVVKPSDGPEQIDQTAEDIMDIGGPCMVSRLKELEEKKGKTQKNAKKVTKSLPLEVVSQVPHLSEKSISQLYEKQLEMTHQDKMEEARMNERNALEAFVYDMKCLLENELLPFIAGQESQTLNGHLVETENWLYDEGDQQPIAAIMEKRAFIEGVLKPILLRKTECENQVKVIKEFQGSLNEALNNIDLHSSGHPNFAHVSQHNISQAHKIIDQKLALLSNYSSQQIKHQHYDSQRLVTEQILEEKQSFEQTMQSLFKKS